MRHISVGSAGSSGFIERFAGIVASGRAEHTLAFFRAAVRPRALATA